MESTHLTTNSGNASFDMVFVPRYATVTSQTVTLNPDGTRFVSLYAAITKLTAGRFRFWSGAAVTYDLSRHGATVSGANA